MKKLIEMVAIEEKIREIDKKEYERDKCIEEIKTLYMELKALKK